MSRMQKLSLNDIINFDMFAKGIPLSQQRYVLQSVSILEILYHSQILRHD